MEPSSKRQLTILGLIVVVLLVLFFVAAFHHPDKGSGPGCSSDQLQTWRERLFHPEPVARGQLSGCTTALGAFVIPTSCALKIAAADTRSRRLVVEAIDKIQLSFVTDADGRKLTMNVDLERAKNTELSIGKDGQRIVLVCRNGNTTCQANLK
jgi:hypothetical protein